MKKIALGILIGLLITVLVTGATSAGKPSIPPKVNLPSKAREVAPGVFSLGMAIDRGKLVQGYAFVDYKKGFGKPGTECGNGVCEPSENKNNCPEDCGEGGSGGGEKDTSNCYAFLAREAKWKIIEDYLVNPQNNSNLDEIFVRENLAYDIEKWETVTNRDILGDEVTGIVDGADLEKPDDKNEVYFADITSPGAIGITVVWGIFSGPPWARELVEWDQVYDDVDFNWSADCLSEDCSSKMDFENIATHELGHSVGLDDLYEDKCSEQTMYGYASYGETKKRTLEEGDIRGIQELYN